MSAEEWDGAEPSEAEVRWLYGDQPGDAPEDSWAPQNLAELPDAPPVQPTLGGIGIVYPGKRHVFSGPQESAKTLAAYVIGLSVVRAGQKLVLIDFEMGPWDAKTRLRELGATEDEMAEIAYVDPTRKATQPDIDRLIALEPGLVIVDAGAGAFQLQDLDDNKRGDVERLNALYVTPFWKVQIATIVVDHVTKSTEHRGAYAIGSERKVGATDVHLGFTVVKPISRGETGIYKVTTHKDRGGCLKRGHLCDFKLASDPETHAISHEFVAPPVVDESHPFRPTVLMERVSRYLEMRDEPVSRRQVEKEVTGKGTGIRTALDVLRDEGWITQSETTNGTVVQSVERYREDENGGASPVRPYEGHTPPERGASPCPSPYGGTQGDAPTESGGHTPRASLLDDDDGIPF